MARELQSTLCRRELYIDTRQGLFFCVTCAIFGSILFFLYHLPPPLFVKELIDHLKAVLNTSTGIKEMVNGVTNAPYCSLISGTLLLGFCGWIIDRCIGNGTSALCRISHLISISGIDKPLAKQIIVKGLSQQLVEDRLGIPLQIVTREHRKLWVYKSIKITFENGKVALIE
jgi:hypothetical protein